ncbi:MAG: hypothetical protein QOH50_5012 [Kribbellaceae bacterium]|jgi:hypothetical protein|nr:hypothetical protein [Kribbellaceae bacterium]
MVEPGQDQTAFALLPMVCELAGTTLSSSA